MALAASALLQFSPGKAGAAPAVKLADHPTSRLTAYPGIHSARKLLNCACTVVSCDPAANTPAVEHPVASGSVE